MISNDKFKTVVENAPLVSIDFIIENRQGHFLLGKRINKPAQGYWFTLGGRIFKDDRIDEAIKRLSRKEFNLEMTREMLLFHGVYEHFYDDSFVDEAVSTHYIVLAYRLKIEDELTLPSEQHSEYRFFPRNEILERDDIHPYTKDYFKESK